VAAAPITIREAIQQPNLRDSNTAHLRGGNSRTRLCRAAARRTEEAILRRPGCNQAVLLIRESQSHSKSLKDSIIAKRETSVTTMAAAI